MLTLAALCAARLAGPVPGPWKEDARDVRRALGRAGDVVTDAWYAGVVSRLHLNAIRADAEGASTALCALPSFLNHDADPSVLIDYAGGGVAFRAARPLAPGDELTIDYVYGHAVDDRSAFLRENYGFEET